MAPMILTGVMLYITVFAGALALFTATTTVSGECPDAWITFRGSCYHFGHSSLTFQDAETFCQHYGGHLVNIGDSIENSFIMSYLAELKEPNHWIGLKDDVIEGLWTWYDVNQIANFTSFAPGQPDQHQLANCAAIWASYGYKWVDETCDHKFKPLCEKRLQRSPCSVNPTGPSGPLVVVG